MALSGCQFLRNFTISSKNILSETTTSKIFHKSINQFYRQSFNRNLSICFIKNSNVTTTSQNDVGRRKFSCSSLILQNNKENKPIESVLNEENNPINIGDGTWTEVYSGVLTAQLKLLKMFSIGSSLIGLSMQPILYEKLGTANVAIVVSLASFLGFFTFITPALIHWVSKKYVTKLEYDPKSDMYAATTLSFFLKEKKVHFKVDDVIRPDVPGMFTSFLVKNKPLFVDPSMFEDVDHYSRIMGFDKPVDFSLDRNNKKR